MQSISIWARNHKWASRFFIVVMQVLLTVLALFSGKSLQELSFRIHPAILWGAILTFITIAICYPDKKQKKNYASAHDFYIRQKACDFLLSACTFLMICCSVNSPVNVISLITPSYGALLIEPASGDASAYKIPDDIKPGVPPVKLTPTQRRALIRELKIQLRQTFHSDREHLKNRGWKAALVLLALVVATGLFAILAGLVCSLSCNGSGGAAVLVAILGTAGIVTLLIFVIKAIYKRRPPKHFRDKEAITPAPVLP